MPGAGQPAHRERRVVPPGVVHLPARQPAAPVRQLPGARLAGSFCGEQRRPRALPGHLRDVRRRRLRRQLHVLPQPVRWRVRWGLLLATWSCTSHAALSQILLETLLRTALQQT